MDAHKAIITNIFNNSTLIEVPFFQRSYVWKEDLWARMIEDMEYIVKTNKPHFFGSIILKEGRKPHPGENFTDCRTIVDGCSGARSLANCAQYASKNPHE